MPTMNSIDILAIIQASYCSYCSSDSRGCEYERIHTACTGQFIDGPFAKWAYIVAQPMGGRLSIYYLCTEQKFLQDWIQHWWAEEIVDAFVTVV